MDWRPIETAPKDGVVILIFTPSQIVTGTWESRQGGPGVSSDIPQEPNWCVYANGEKLLDEGWDEGAGWFMEIEGATHWMPLPDKPL